MPNYLDRFPRDGYEANAMLGERRSLSLGARTRIERIGPDIIETYRGRRVLTFQSHGGIMLPRLLGARFGDHRWAIAARVNHVLPANWRVSATRQRLYLWLIYREAYRLDLSDVLTFEPDGNLTYGGYPLRMRDIETSAREILGIEGSYEPAPMPAWAGRSPRTTSEPPRRRRRTAADARIAPELAQWIVDWRIYNPPVEA